MFIYKAKHFYSSNSSLKVPPKERNVSPKSFVEIAVMLSEGLGAFFYFKKTSIWNYDNKLINILFLWKCDYLYTIVPILLNFWK